MVQAAGAAVVDAMAGVDPGVTDTLAEVLAAGNATGGTDIAVGTGDDITFADSSKAIFGAGNDFLLYHDGAHSYVQDNGNGELRIKTNGSMIQFLDGSNNYLIRAATGGDVSLYHNTAQKLSTTSTGIDVTGVITTDGLTTSADINFGDSDKAVFGAGSDLQIYHDGNHSYIEDAGTGSIKIKVGDFRVENASGNNLIKGVGDIATLHHAGSEKLATTSTGIDVTGVITTDGLTTSADINFGDSDKAIFGAGSDLQIYHDGSHSYISDSGTGYLRILASDYLQLMSSSSEVYINAAANGGVTLYHDNSGKISTTSTGIQVIGKHSKCFWQPDPRRCRKHRA